MAHAQTCVFLIAEKKNMDCELRAQLCMGVYELYNSALNLANDSLKKRVSDVMRSLLNFKRMFFSATSFLKMKDVCENEFKKSGEKYGKQIAYISMAIMSLNAASKEFTKISGPELEQAKTLFNTLPKLKEEMIDKNNRLYYDHIPEISSIPKIEKIVRVNAVSVMEDLNKPVDNHGIFDNLIPREARALIEKYKMQMNDYISQGLDKQENDVKILQFLNDENLPHNLDSTMGSEISDSLWKRVSEVQQKGGALFLTNQIANVASRCGEVNKRLRDLEVVLSSEKDEDNRLRLLYGDKWKRKPSEVLNQNYYNTLNDYLSKIIIFKLFLIKIILKYLLKFI